MFVYFVIKHFRLNICYAMVMLAGVEAWKNEQISDKDKKRVTKISNLFTIKHVFDII